MNFHSSDFANSHRWFFDLEFVRTRNKNAENLSDDAIIESILDPDNRDPYAPNVLFDAEHCSTALGVTRNLENVVLRYLQEGMRRGVSPNPLFDPSFYLSQCTHLLQNPSAAIEDCLNRVRRNERLLSFHPFFDEDFIRKDRDFGAPAAFYSALFGGEIYEVRSHALVDFDYLGYQLDRTFDSYSEALAAYWDAEHDVSTHVLFDLDFYRTHLGEDTDIRRGVYHHLVSDTQHSPQPLFDPSFYRQAAKETFGQLPERPFEHYVQQGQYCGLDPSPFFDTQHYTSQTNCEDAPLEHFLRDGHLSASGHALLRFAQSRLHAAASNHSDTAIEALLATEPDGVPQNVMPEFDPTYWKNRSKETLSPHANYSETRDHYLRFGFLNQRAPNGLLNRTYIAEQIAFMWGDNSAPITHYFRQGWHLRNRVLFAVDDLEDTSINRTLAAALRLQLGTIDLDVVVVTRAGGSLEKEFTRFAHIWHLPAKIGGAKDDPHLQNNYARLRHALKGNPPQIGYIQADQDLHLLADLGDICAKNVLFSNASPLKFSQDLEQALAGGLDHILSSSLAETDLKETALQQIDVTPTQGYAGNVLSAQSFAPETARRNEIRAKLDISDDAYVVVGSGSFSLENGIDFFGVVGARLAADWSRDRDLHFVWVGDGPKYANTNYFYANYFAELSGNPHLFQTVDNLELKEVLAASDVYLDTKRDGTASSTVSYAQKMGLATITMARAHSEQMQDDKRKACRPFDLQEITSTLSELAETVVSDIGIEQPQSIETDFAMAFLGDLNACARSVGFKDLFVSRLLFNPAQRVLVVSGTSFLNKLVSAGLSPKQPSQVGQLKFRPRQLSRSNLPIGIKAALHVGGAIEYTARALNAELSASIFDHYDKVLWVLDGTQNEVADIYRLGNLAEEILVANDTFISEMMEINPSIAAKMRFQKEVLS